MDATLHAITALVVFLAGIHTETRFVNPDQCTTYPLFYGDKPYMEQGWVDPADGAPHYCVEDGPSFWVYRVTFPDGQVFQQIGVVAK